jgi:hypothetical protein
MSKIFPFNPVDAQRRADAARRAAVKAALDAARAEQQRLAGEKAAGEIRNIDVWFQQEATAEAGAKRNKRVAAAVSRPACIRAIPQDPNRTVTLALFEGEGAVFFARTTDKDIEKRARWFDRFLREAEARIASFPEGVPDQQIAQLIVERHAAYARYKVRAALSWLMWNVKEYRERLFDPEVAGIGLAMEGTTMAFVEYPTPGSQSARELADQYKREALDALLGAAVGALA